MYAQYAYMYFIPILFKHIKYGFVITTHMGYIHLFAQPNRFKMNGLRCPTRSERVYSILWNENAITVLYKHIHSHTETHFLPHFTINCTFVCAGILGR